MTQKRTTGIVVGLIVGLLMLGGCGGESSQTGGTGQVILQAPGGAITADEAGSKECTMQDGSTPLVISATLDIVGVRTDPMHVNSDCSVTATVPNVPVGTWTFRITYRAGSGNARLVIAEASGVGTVAANTTIHVPLALAKLSGPATAVATGFNHSCARLADGTVNCWGNNNFGQLGDGATGLSERRPVAIEDFPSVAAIATGTGHSCARLTTNPVTLEASSTVWCWGLNSFGQLGLNAPKDLTSDDPDKRLSSYSTPVQVAILRQPDQSINRRDRHRRRRGSQLRGLERRDSVVLGRQRRRPAGERKKSEQAFGCQSDRGSVRGGGSLLSAWLLVAGHRGRW